MQPGRHEGQMSNRAIGGSKCDKEPFPTDLQHTPPDVLPMEHRFRPTALHVLHKYATITSVDLRK